MPDYEKAPTPEEYEQARQKLLEGARKKDPNVSSNISDEELLALSFSEEGDAKMGSTPDALENAANKEVAAANAMRTPMPGYQLAAEINRHDIMEAEIRLKLDKNPAGGLVESEEPESAEGKLERLKRTFLDYSDDHMHALFSRNGEYVSFTQEQCRKNFDNLSRQIQTVKPQDPWSKIWEFNRAEIGKAIDGWRRMGIWIDY